MNIYKIIEFILSKTNLIPYAKRYNWYKKRRQKKIERMLLTWFYTVFSKKELVPMVELCISYEPYNADEFDLFALCTDNKYKILNKGHLYSYKFNVNSDLIIKSDIDIEEVIIISMLQYSAIIEAYRTNSKDMINYTNYSINKNRIINSENEFTNYSKAVIIHSENRLKEMKS